MIEFQKAVFASGSECPMLLGEDGALIRMEELFRRDISLSDIASSLDFPLEVIQSRISRMGLRRYSSCAWDDTEHDYLQQKFPLLSCAEVGLYLGRAPWEILARAEALSLKRDLVPSWSTWEIELIAAGFSAATEIAEIAEFLGRPSSEIRSYAIENGLRRRSRPISWSAGEESRARDFGIAGYSYRSTAMRLAMEGYPPRSRKAVAARMRSVGVPPAGDIWGREEDDALIGAANKGQAAIKAAASRLGRKPSEILWRYGILGLKPPRGSGAIIPWDAARREYLSTFYGKRPAAEIALHLEVSVRAVYMEAHRLNLGRGDERRWTVERDEQLRLLSKDPGCGLSDAAGIIGRSYFSTAKRAADLGIEFVRKSRNNFAILLHSDPR